MNRDPLDDIVPPLNPVTELPGVGEKTANELEAQGVRTVKDFRESPDAAEKVPEKFRDDAKRRARVSTGDQIATQQQKQRKTTDKEVLQRVEGIGPKRSEALVERFGSGRQVEQAVSSGFGKVAETEGISSDTAKELFGRFNDAGVRNELKDRRRGEGEVRGVPRPTDIGRQRDGEYARPETAPDIQPAPVARNTQTGEFGIDPFDITNVSTGQDTDPTGDNGGSRLGGDIGTLASEQGRSEQADTGGRIRADGGDSGGRREVNLPDETVSFARTQLNRAVDQEGRDELDDLRQRFGFGTDGFGSDTIELDRDEFQTVSNLVSEQREKAEDRAERMDANIFGDTDDQADFARTADRGLEQADPFDMSEPGGALSGTAGDRR